MWSSMRVSAFAVASAHRRSLSLTANDEHDGLKVSVAGGHSRADDDRKKPKDDVVSSSRRVVLLTPLARAAGQWRPSDATWTRASLKQAPAPRSVSESGTRALDVEPL